MTAWNDEMWILVLQLLKQKPQGIKPMYSRQTVALALELHITPEEIYRRMFMLRNPATPSLKLLVDTYGSSMAKLNREAEKVRRLMGCGNAEAFYEGVTVNETFEKDFRPLNSDTSLTPIMLVMILDLYFRLVPSTMVVETPDVKELAELMHITPQDVVDVLEIYQYCDPYITHADSLFDPLLPDCHKVWRRFDCESDPMALSNLASQLKAYWTSKSKV